MPMLGQSAQMEQCKLAVQVCTITKFNKQEENTMVKTICEKIMTKEITSVELKSVLGKELYICNGNCWTDVLDEFGFTYSSEQFCQYIADYEAWAELNNVYVEILEGKAEFRSSINAAKELLKEWLEYNELEKFRSLYSTLSARQKEAVLCILRYSEILDMDLMCPTTSELSLLWKDSIKKQKHKANLLIPVMETDCTYTINLFTGKVVGYADIDTVEDIL